MQQKRIVPVLCGRNTMPKALVCVLRRVKAVAPRFSREGGIGDDKIKGLQQAVRLLEEWSRQGVILDDHRRWAVVQDHIHLGKRRCRIVHLLPVDGQV